MTLDEIKDAIIKLSYEERADLRARLLAFDWDRQAEDDAKAGKRGAPADGPHAEHEVDRSHKR